jgi:hypothetical protein
MWSWKRQSRGVLMLLWTSSELHFNLIVKYAYLTNVWPQVDMHNMRSENSLWDLSRPSMCLSSMFFSLPYPLS